MRLSWVINCWGDPTDLCSSLSYCVGLFWFPKYLVKQEQPCRDSTWPPLLCHFGWGSLLFLCFPAPVTLVTAVVMFAAQHLSAMAWPGLSLDCSLQVLLAPCVGYRGLSQRDGLCACPCVTFRFWMPCCVQRNHQPTSLVSCRCCTAQCKDRPLWCLQNTRQTYGSIAELGSIIISISHYHNETQGRKQTAAH